MGAISTETFDREDNQHDLTHWHDKIEVIRVIDHEMYCAVNGTEHLLLALLQQDESLVDRLLARMNINHEGVKVQAQKLVEKQVKVSGGGQVYVGDGLSRALMRAEDEAKQMGDPDYQRRLPESTLRGARQSARNQ